MNAKKLIQLCYQPKRSNKTRQRILRHATKSRRELKIVRAVLSSFDDDDEVKHPSVNYKRTFDEMNEVFEATKYERIEHLTQRQKDLLQNELEMYENDNIEFRNCSGQIVKRLSMNTLQPGRELNDEIINHFYSLLQKELNENVMFKQKNVFLTTHFIPTLIHEKNGYCFDKIKNWSFRRRIGDLFQQHKVIIPCHVNGNHWTCAIICITTKRIYYLDPLIVTSTNNIPGFLKQYLEDEWNAFGRTREFNRLEWNVVKPGKGEIPRQTNNYDCGVYVCMYAYYMSQNKRINFLSSDINIIRQRMTYSIMKQKLCIH